LSVPEIECIVESDELYSKVKRMQLNGKYISTPSRSITTSIDKLSPGVMLKESAHKGLSETFVSLNKEKIHAMGRHNGTEQTFLSRIRYKIKRSDAANDIHYIFIKYDTRTGKEIKSKIRKSETPVDKELHYLFDILNARHNDIIIPPIMPYLNGLQYQDVLKRLYEIKESYSNKPLAGLIPSTLSRDDQSKILSLSLKNDSRIIFYDFYGMSPDRHYTSTNMVMRTLRDLRKESKEERFLIGSNVLHGRPHRTTAIAPAKDLLAFYAGFDAYSDNHVPKMAIENKGGKPPKPKPPVFRTLDLSSYGYEIIDSRNIQDIENEINQIPGLLFDKYSEDTNKTRKIIKCFNGVKQAEEAKNIQLLLLNEQKISEYLRGKTTIEKEIVDQLLNGYKQKSIQTFF